jgi:hypothetical protein
MNHFPSFNPNEPALHQLSATKLNSVSQGQKSNQIQPGVGYRVTQTPGGTTVSVIKRRARAATSDPLKLTIKQGTAADKFQIIPGTVNGLMPTLSATALDATTPPEITVTADTWAWIKVVGTFGDPDTYVVTIVTESTDSVPTGTDISATGFVAYYYIGKITDTDNTPDPNTYEIENRHGGGNLGVDSWGLYNLWWRA